MHRALVLLMIAVAALLAGTGERALAQENQLQVDCDTSTPGIQDSVIISPASGPFTVEVWVEGVTTTDCNPLYPGQPCGLGGYEVEMSFDQDVVSYSDDSFADGAFLTSTGRSYFICPAPTVNHEPLNGVISQRCTTQGWEPLGPLGDGHLSTVTFAPAGIGSTVLEIGQSVLTDIAGEDPICDPYYTACDTLSCEVFVNYKADLGVTKSAPASVAAPNNVAYDIDVTNNGPDGATDVTLVDILPSKADFVSVTPGAPTCTYDGVGHEVTCDLGSMASSQTQPVDITVSVEALDAGASLFNVVDVSATALDPNAANDHAEASTTVDPSSVSITKTAPRFFGPDPTGQYVIDVTSTGPSTAASVTMTDSLDPSITYLGHSTTLDTCTYEGGPHRIYCDFGDMAASASATITIDVQFEDTVTTVCNAASVVWMPLASSSSGQVCTRADTDGDFCSDDHENGCDPLKGGQRDPLDPWDFYDVPVPTLRLGGTMADRDSAVTLFNDVLAVLEYSGTVQSCPGDTPTPEGATTCGSTGNGAACCSDNPNGAGIDYDKDMDGDTVADGLAYDRSVMGTWSGAPDGSVTLFNDVLLVLAQSGHVCMGVPSPPPPC